MLKNIFQDFFSLIYPSYCYACEEDLEKGEETLCTNCRLNLPRAAFEPDDENEILKRFWGKVKVENGFAFYKFEKKSKVQKLLHHLKYSGKEEIGIAVGTWLGKELKEKNIHRQFDLIIPVPLHKQKLKKRGYNQADSFACGLSESMEVPWSNTVLKKIIATETQTKKGRYERFKNVENVFAVEKPELIKNKHILLVDDVITTGSTFESAMTVLLNNGVEKVSIATIATANR